eukprot:CAMPEP_0175890694 /NCGR_PEP_ID=MMETSP0107_2-20121207/47958_1 /TAXON_ID=195067 ORGANISM="Goniomonas pacifica, Strain CCMP1869" /NCGR_SAMPLE_ID=MMETSP0107_2 /ASSEMBLY_ACC=CAM_ASM_000203 /LENGTH=46 /DNA_ID= /DNA_START= /DNA_END= /DNA_ORIENTATION=
MELMPHVIKAHLTPATHPLYHLKSGRAYADVMESVSPRSPPSPRGR